MTYVWHVSPVQILMEDFKRVIDDLVRFHGRSLGTVDLPPVDLCETEEMFIVKADLPSVDPKTVEVTLLRDHLVIKGIKSEPPAAGKVNYICLERSFGPFLRMLSLGQPIDPDGITATIRNGCLVIKLKKIPERRGAPVVIPVAATPEETSGRNEQ